MPSAPCWKDAEQRKANQRLGSRDPLSISCERREWEKGRWFCAITGKPVLVLYCLCWGFGVLKNHSYLGQEKIPKAGAKTLNIPKCEEAVMWSHKSVWWLSDHLGPSPLSHQACAEHDFLWNHVVCSWSGWQPLPEPVFDVPDWLASHSNGMDCLQIVRIHLAVLKW